MSPDPWIKLTSGSGSKPKLAVGLDPMIYSELIEVNLSLTFEQQMTNLPPFTMFCL